MLMANAQKLILRIEFSNACFNVAFEEMNITHTCGLLAHLDIVITIHDSIDALLDVENLTS